MNSHECRHPDIDKVLLDPPTIRARVEEMGRQITRDYSGKRPVLVGILKGSVPFLADLMRSIELECTVDFICLASYEGESSSGVVRLLLDLREGIAGKDVLVIEDLVDTGLTLSYLLQNLDTRAPRSLEICALLDKPECRKTRVDVRYVGFTIQNEFVVGYGLDYAERYRQLPYVGVLSRSVVGTRGKNA